MPDSLRKGLQAVGIWTGALLITVTAPHHKPERIALALFKWHGFDLGEWPAGVRKTLGF